MVGRASGGCKDCSVLEEQEAVSGGGEHDSNKRRW